MPLLSCVGRAANRFVNVRYSKKLETHIFESFGTALALRHLGLGHAITNSNKLSIDVFKSSPQRVSDRLLDLFLDQRSSKWAKGLVQKIVFRVANGEFKRPNLDVDVLDAENRRVVALSGLKHNRDLITCQGLNNINNNRSYR